MMGLKERAFAPLVAVSLEELVPQDHFYRHLQKVLDLSFVYDLVREHYSIAGRPSIDPIVFFKLRIVMLFEDIRVSALTHALRAYPKTRTLAKINWAQAKWRKAR